MDRLGLGTLPAILLERSLQLHGECIALARLHSWLGIGITAYDRLRGRLPDACLAVRTWLERRPEVQEHVLGMGLRACRDDDRLSLWDYRNRKRLFGAKLPDDLGLWHLRQAVELVGTRPRLAKHLFRKASHAHTTGAGAAGHSAHVLQAHAQKDSQLAELLAVLQSQPPPARDESDWQAQRDAFRKERERERRKFRDAIGAAESDLLANRAEPGILYHLGLVYFGESPYAQGDLRRTEAIVHSLGETGIVAAAIHRLRNAVGRDDLPSVSEIIRLAGNRREHYLNLPLMAAMDLRECESPGSTLELDLTVLRRCVACCHSWLPISNASNRKPLW